LRAGQDAIELPPGADDSTSYVKNGAVVNFPPKPDKSWVWSPLAGAWVDPRPLAQLKTDAKAAMSKARDVADAAGFVWNAFPFQSDLVSRGKIGLNVTLAAVSLVQRTAFSQSWTTADGTDRNLVATDWVGVGQALAAMLTANNARLLARKAAIDAAADAAAVAASSGNPHGRPVDFSLNPGTVSA
jgi:hypothetical protein